MCPILSDTTWKRGIRAVARVGLSGSFSFRGVREHGHLVEHVLNTWRIFSPPRPCHTEQIFKNLFPPPLEKGRTMSSAANKYTATDTSVADTERKVTGRWIVPKGTVSVLDSTKKGNEK